MPSPFSITAATNSLRLDERRRSQTTFTVFNAAGRPLRGRARLAAPDDQTIQPWLKLEGEAERLFPIAGAEQYVVAVEVPPEAEKGSYRFRLDMIDVERPDDPVVQGPAVTFEVEEAVVVNPPWWKEKMWMILVAVGVLVLGGIAAFLFIPDGEEEVPDVVEVPRVAGLTTEQAEEALRTAGFSLGRDQEAFSDTLDAGLVIGTDPAGKVEEGTQVALIVSKGPDLVSIPDVSGNELLTAIARLDSSGLQLADSVRLQHHGSIPEGRVIRTDPNVNTEVPRKTPVALIASKGPSGSDPNPGGGFGGLVFERFPDVVATPNVILIDSFQQRRMLESRRFNIPQQ